MSEKATPAKSVSSRKSKGDQRDSSRVLRHANWIQLSNALLLLAAAIIAAWSVLSARETARQSAADATWERYMELAFQYPDLESDRAPFADGDSPEDVRYTWFVERGLFAGEQILSFEPDDPQWQDSIAWEVVRHRRYILSNTFLGDAPQRMSSFCSYIRPLRDVIVHAFQGDAAATRRLTAANQRCQAILTARGRSDL